MSRLAKLSKYKNNLTEKEIRKLQSQVEVTLKLEVISPLPFWWSLSGRHDQDVSYSRFPNREVSSYQEIYNPREKMV